jgi:2-polyprenyl-3-methyl-5-hydroxy-6-metoxy-1,4-benzoquinol methylase
MSIVRTQCCICHSGLTNIYSLQNIPVTLSCVDFDDFKFETLSFSQCNACNTIQLDKLIPLNILYEKSHNTTSVGKAWANYFQLFAKTIETTIIKKNILEIGCPSGKIAESCHDYSTWYIVEPNKNENAILNDKIVFIQKFFDDDFSLNEKVDVIIHSHLFEHIYEPNKFLKKCHTLLSENGEMIFGVPNMEHIAEQSLSLYLGIFFEHTIFLNKENITYLLNNNGFEVSEIIDYEKHSTIYRAKKHNNIPLKSDIVITNYFTNFFDLKIQFDNFIEKCNSFVTTKNKYVFAASYNTQLLLCNGLNTNGIAGILDNCKEKQGKYLYGTKLKIYSPEILQKEDAVVILKSGYYSEEIHSQIKNINENTIVIK